MARHLHLVRVVVLPTGVASFTEALMRLASYLFCLSTIVLWCPQANGENISAITDTEAGATIYFDADSLEIIALESTTTCTTCKCTAHSGETRLRRHCWGNGYSGYCDCDSGFKKVDENTLYCKGGANCVNIEQL